VRGDVSVDSETLLMTVFMNLKIKSTQYVFIKLSAHTYMSIYVCTDFFKKRMKIRCRQLEKKKKRRAKEM
jgi:hypothetical protein